MNRTLAYKLGAIALLILLLLIPLLMIDGLIRDRQEVRDGVLQDIARSSSYSQRLTGPLLVVPYRRTVREWVTEEKTEKRVLQEREQRGELYFLPDRFALDGQMRTELRYRGIYQARLYHVDNKVAGYFQVPAHYGIEEDLEDYQFETPFLAMASRMPCACPSTVPASTSSRVAGSACSAAACTHRCKASTGARRSAWSTPSTCRCSAASGWTSCRWAATARSS